MMDASLDTDVIIHLYLSGKKELIFTFFDKLYLHEYLFETELKHNSKLIYQELRNDVENGKLEIITNRKLIDMGVKHLFEEYKRDYEYLFDRGELYAVSLAKAIGVAAFISDDTKEYGPHETLVNELIEDVIPFAFYELLFLKYLSSNITLGEMQQEFKYINSKSMIRFPMDFRGRMLKMTRRFSQRFGTKRDYSWIYEFCDQQNVNYKDKMRGVKDYLFLIDTNEKPLTKKGSGFS